MNKKLIELKKYAESLEASMHTMAGLEFYAMAHEIKMQLKGVKTAIEIMEAD